MSDSNRIWSYVAQSDANEYQGHCIAATFVDAVTTAVQRLEDARGSEEIRCMEVRELPPFERVPLEVPVLRAVRQ